MQYWKPSTTVAAVVERDGKFLMIEEQTREGLKLNQPAGHLDPGETLIDAVARETMKKLALTSPIFAMPSLVGQLPSTKDVR
jgi:phosphatase NudJ